MSGSDNHAEGQQPSHPPPPAADNSESTVTSTTPDYPPPAPPAANDSKSPATERHSPSSASHAGWAQPPVEGDYPPYASGGLLPEAPAELQASVPPQSYQTNFNAIDERNLNDLISPQSTAVVSFLLPPASEQHEPTPTTPGAAHDQIFSPIMVDTDEKRVPSPSASANEAPHEDQIFSPLPVNKDEKRAPSPSATGAPHDDQMFSPIPVHTEENRVPSPSYSNRDEQQPPSPISDTIDEQPAAPPSTDPKEEKIPHRGFQEVEPDGAGQYAAVDGVAGSDSSAAQPHKKTWGGRFSNLGQRAAAKIGSPSFLPQSIDKECEKAAQIVKAFCKEGVYTETSAEPSRSDSTKNKVKSRARLTIPRQVIANAVGLAIFTTLRGGWYVTGAMGSGLLVSRLPDGSWSPPSAIQVLSAGAGLQFGVDIYDCVCVINTREALSAFTKTRISIGGDMAVSAGPWGAGSAVDVGTSVGSKKKGKEVADPVPTGSGAGVTGDDSSSATSLPRQDSNHLQPEHAGAKPGRRIPSPSFKPVFSYVKSRGLYVGVQVDGTVIVERKDANAAFYGGTVGVDQILRGEVPMQGGQWPAGARVLHDVLRGAEGRSSYAQSTASFSNNGLPHEVASGSTAASVDDRASIAAPPSSIGVGSSRPVESRMYEKGGYAESSSAAAETRSQIDTTASQRGGDAEPPAYIGSPVDEPPPAYEEDGVQRPEVGDKKQG